MAKRKELEQEEEGAIKLDETYDKLENFLEENQQIVTGVLLGLLLIIGGYMLYKNLIVAPREHEAHEQIFKAQQYFEADSFRLALEGDGNYLGFEDISTDYKGSKPGKLAKYYAGICHLNLGNFEDAIYYLEKFKSKDPVIQSIAYGGLGDAYSELDNMERSVDFYKKAAKTGNNEITTPLYLMRAGKALESLSEYGKAMDVYNELIDLYPNVSDATDARKNIMRIETLSSN